MAEMREHFAHDDPVSVVRLGLLSSGDAPGRSGVLAQGIGDEAASAAAVRPREDVDGEEELSPGRGPRVGAGRSVGRGRRVGAAEAACESAAGAGLSFLNTSRRSREAARCTPRAAAIRSAARLSSARARRSGSRAAE